MYRPKDGQTNPRMEILGRVLNVTSNRNLEFSWAGAESSPLVGGGGDKNHLAELIKPHLDPGAEGDGIGAQDIAKNKRVTEASDRLTD